MGEKHEDNNKNKAVGRLITSIAKEEHSLGDILYQEGRKIDKALCYAKCVDDLVKIDCSVQDTLKEIAKAEILLLQKLEEAGEILCKKCLC